MDSVISDISLLENNASTIGLSLNHSKCEVIGLNSSNQELWMSTDFHFQECSLHEATLLGTPIQAAGVDQALSNKIMDLELMMGRLSFLPAHAALYLLRNAIALPKLLYILRTSPCFVSEQLHKYDITLRSMMSSLLNIELSNPAWNQATLPLRWGGIGVRSAHRLAPSAFLASAAGATALLSQILLNRIMSIPDPAVDQATMTWMSLGGTVFPNGAEANVQRCWDESISKAVAEQLMEGADERSLARLRASRAAESGAWLKAIPSSSLGLNLDNSSLRIAVGLRLGCPLGLEHQCICGSVVDKFGQHGLVCKRSAGRHIRHNLLNDTILRGLQSAGVPSLREPPGLSRSDFKRPDGVTLIPWSRGRCLLWDATCPDTLAPSHLSHTSIEAGAAAMIAEGNKVTKYASLSVGYEFVPVAIETLGSWGPAGLAFVNEVGRRITSVTGDIRAASFLRQRLSLAVQRGNAVAVLGTHAASEHSADVFAAC